MNTRSEVKSGAALSTARVRVLKGPDFGRECVANRDAMTVGVAEDNDLRLTDDTVSRYHCELRVEGDRISIADLGSTNGTFYAGARIERGAVPPGSTLVLGRTEIAVERCEASPAELYASDRMGKLIGRTEIMRRMMSRVERIARSDVSVLLIGESGTGKEVVARLIHDLSPRANKPFETVDCGSLLPALIASELFGHEKGAFTGAVQAHQGAFERADGGTLFLDEIGDLPAALQPALLGALERRTFRRVGGKASIPVDVRLISATNRDLRSEVNAGTFRLDLYYRLAATLLEIPPLRKRLEDIPLLVEHFFAETGVESDLATIIPAHALRALESHHWPGNVRELRNFVAAAAALGETPHLDSTTAKENVVSAFNQLLRAPYNEAKATLLASFELQYLTELMQRAGGSVSEAARSAKMNRSHLLEMLKRHGLREGT